MPRAPLYPSGRGQPAPAAGSFAVFSAIIHCSQVHLPIDRTMARPAPRSSTTSTAHLRRGPNFGGLRVAVRRIPDGRQPCPKVTFVKLVENAEAVMGGTGQAARSGSWLGDLVRCRPGWPRRAAPRARQPGHQHELLGLVRDPRRTCLALLCSRPAPRDRRSESIPHRPPRRPSRRPPVSSAFRDASSRCPIVAIFEQ